MWREGIETHTPTVWEVGVLFRGFGWGEGRERWDDRINRLWAPPKQEGEQRFVVSHTFWCSEENLLSETFLDSIYFCFKTTQRVSPYSSDLEMNLTSSFSYRVINLWSVRTCFSHLQEQCRTRICSSSKSDSRGGVAMLSAVSQVGVTLGLWKNNGSHVNPCFLQDPWAHNLKRWWDQPDSRYSPVVDRGKVQSRWKGSWRKLRLVRVIVKERVQVPSEGVLLIKGVLYDMLHDGVNYFWTTHNASPGLEPSKM